MRTLDFPAHPGRSAPTLLVLLQGAYSAPEDFIHHGFIDALRQTGAPADVVLADNDPRYVSEGCVAMRVEEDVIQPRRQAGQRLWLAGISLGAFSALAWASQYPAGIDGICLIAPYPGTQEVLRPIREAGSLAAWAAQPRPANEDDEHRVWRWLADWHGRRHSPTLWFGTGETDRFRAGQDQIAALLPPTHVHTVAGGHDWPQWCALWQGFLAQNLLHGTES
ncbi:MAG: alpha/beta hydrolase [Uliginosibacterium sp.]|nr:alpha/beta hydrolase [Uliginosibacterium sp.]